MRISIVTISLNQAEFLQNCIDSVRFQKFDNYEHIVVDPGSSDGSRELIIRATDSNPSIRFIFEPDLGPGDGLNKGLKSANGDIFVYLNADDELAPGALQYIDEHFRSTNCDVLIGNGWSIDRKGRPIAFLRSDVFSPNLYALGLGVVVQQATAFRTKTLSANDIEFNNSNRVSWDIELLFDLHRLGVKFDYTSKVLGYFRKYEETITGNPAFKNALKEQKANLVGRTSFSNIPSFGKIISVPARALKWTRKSLFLIWTRPKFPGSASNV